jgi:hypothetical protein
MGGSSEHTKPPPDEVPVPKTRFCLMCSEKFVSKWKGDRVCKRCKGTAAWKQGA